MVFTKRTGLRGDCVTFFARPKKRQFAMSDGEEKKLKSILVKPGEKKEKKSGAVVLQEESVQGHDADDPHHKKFIEKSAVIEGHEGLLVRRCALTVYILVLY